MRILTLCYEFRPLGGGGAKVAESLIGTSSIFVFTCARAEDLFTHDRIADQHRRTYQLHAAHNGS